MVGGHRLVDDDVDVPAVLRGLLEQAAQCPVLLRQRIDVPHAEPGHEVAVPGDLALLGPEHGRGGRPCGVPGPFRLGRQRPAPPPSACSRPPAVSRARTVTASATSQRASKTCPSESEEFSVSRKSWIVSSAFSLRRFSLRVSCGAGPTWRPPASQTVSGAVARVVEGLGMSHFAGGRRRALTVWSAQVAGREARPARIPYVPSCAAMDDLSHRVCFGASTRVTRNPSPEELRKTYLVQDWRIRNSVAYAAVWGIWWPPSGNPRCPDTRPAPACPAVDVRAGRRLLCAAGSDRVSVTPAAARCGSPSVRRRRSTPHVWRHPGSGRGSSFRCPCRGRRG